MGDGSRCSSGRRWSARDSDLFARQLIVITPTSSGHFLRVPILSQHLHCGLHGTAPGNVPPHGCPRSALLTSVETLSASHLILSLRALSARGRDQGGREGAGLDSARLLSSIIENPHSDRHLLMSLIQTCNCSLVHYKFRFWLVMSSTCVLTLSSSVVAFIAHVSVQGHSRCMRPFCHGMHVGDVMK